MGPYCAGIKIKEIELVNTDDRGFLEATVRVAWEKARVAVASPGVFVGGAGSATLQVPAQPAQKEPMVAPKTLAPGLWKNGIDTYENYFDPPRVFRWRFYSVRKSY